MISSPYSFRERRWGPVSLALQIAGWFLMLAIRMPPTTMFFIPSLPPPERWGLCALLHLGVLVTPQVTPSEATFKKAAQPWLVWLCWLGIIPQSKRSLFNSRSGHMPGWQVRSQSRHVQEAADWCFSLPEMFLLLLKRNILQLHGAPPLPLWCATWSTLLRPQLFASRASRHVSEQTSPWLWPQPSSHAHPAEAPGTEEQRQAFPAVPFLKSYHRICEQNKVLVVFATKFGLICYTVVVTAAYVIEGENRICW